MFRNFWKDNHATFHILLCWKYTLEEFPMLWRLSNKSGRFWIHVILVFIWIGNVFQAELCIGRITVNNKQSVNVTPITQPIAFHFPVDRSFLTFKNNMKFIPTFSFLESRNLFQKFNYFGTNFQRWKIKTWRQETKVVSEKLRDCQLESSVRTISNESNANLAKPLTVCFETLHEC